MTTMLTISPAPAYSMDITEPIEAAPEVGTPVHDTNRVLSVSNVLKFLAYLTVITIVGAGIPMEISYFWNQANLWGYWGTELTQWAVQHAACWVIGFTALAVAVRSIQRKDGK